MSTEEKIMTMISYAGAGRMKLIEAMRLAGDRKYEEGLQLVDESDKDIVKCHQAQTEILFQNSSDPSAPGSNISVMLIHAMDQVMNTMSMRDLVYEMIHMLERREKHD